MPLLALLAACGMSPDDFAARSIENTCTYGIWCLPNTYAVYDGVAECVEAHEPYLGPFYACYEQFCATFDPEAARACTELPERIDCNAEVPGACAGVWTDCDDVALGACQDVALGVDLD